MAGRVIKARSAAEIDAARGLVWEFFDVMRGRYPEMVEMIDAYIEETEIAKELESFANVFLPPHGECFLALQDGRPVGTVMFKPLSESDGELNRMYVRESARGLGLGRKLGEALVQEARNLGYRRLRLDAPIAMSRPCRSTRALGSSATTIRRRSAATTSASYACDCSSRGKGNSPDALDAAFCGR